MVQQPTLLPGLSLDTLAQDKAFYSMLILKYGMEADPVSNWERYRQRARSLLERTEQVYARSFE